MAHMFCFSRACLKVQNVHEIDSTTPDYLRTGGTPEVKSSNNTYLANIDKSTANGHEFVRVENSQPNDYYKTVSDNSVQSDKEGTDISENEQNKVDVTPKTLQTDLIDKKPSKVAGKKKSLNSQKKVEKIEKGEKLEKIAAVKGKKIHYGPNEEFPNAVSFEPSKMQKKNNPNDSSKIDASMAIRKYKDLENKFVDLEINSVQNKLSKKKIENVHYDESITYGLPSKIGGPKKKFEEEERDRNGIEEKAFNKKFHNNDEYEDNRNDTTDQHSNLQEFSIDNWDTSQRINDDHVRQMDGFVVTKKPKNISTKVKPSKTHRVEKKQEKHYYGKPIRSRSNSSNEEEDEEEEKRMYKAKQEIKRKKHEESLTNNQQQTKYNVKKSQKNIESEDEDEDEARYKRISANASNTAIDMNFQNINNTNMKPGQRLLFENQLKKYYHQPIMFNNAGQLYMNPYIPNNLNNFTQTPLPNNQGILNNILAYTSLPNNQNLNYLMNNNQGVNMNNYMQWQQSQTQGQVQGLGQSPIQQNSILIQQQQAKAKPETSPIKSKKDDTYSCVYCEDIYKMVILSNLELKKLKCLYCGNVTNKESLEFYMKKYKEELMANQKKKVGLKSTAQKEDESCEDQDEEEEEEEEEIKQTKKKSENKYKNDRKKPKQSNIDDEIKIRDYDVEKNEDEENEEDEKTEREREREMERERERERERNNAKKKQEAKAKTSTNAQYREDNETEEKKPRKTNPSQSNEIDSAEKSSSLMRRKDSKESNTHIESKKSYWDRQREIEEKLEEMKKETQVRPVEPDPEPKDFNNEEFRLPKPKIGLKTGIGREKEYLANRNIITNEVIKEDPNEELNDKWVNWISAKNDELKKGIVEATKPEEEVKKTTNNTTADVTNQNHLVMTETINLAEAFRNKKKRLAEKIGARAESVKDVKLRSESVDNEFNEPLEAKRLRNMKKSNTSKVKNQSKEKDRESAYPVSHTVSNFNSAANVEQKKGEPSKELIERLVYGKKVNMTQKEMKEVNKKLIEKFENNKKAKVKEDTGKNEDYNKRKEASRQYTNKLKEGIIAKSKKN